MRDRLRNCSLSFMAVLYRFARQEADSSHLPAGTDNLGFES
jgi:hypothetical protein